MLQTQYRKSQCVRASAHGARCALKQSQGEAASLSNFVPANNEPQRRDTLPAGTDLQRRAACAAEKFQARQHQCGTSLALIAGGGTGRSHALIQRGGEDPQLRAQVCQRDGVPGTLCRGFPLLQRGQGILQALPRLLHFCCLRAACTLVRAGNHHVLQALQPFSASRLSAQQRPSPALESTMSSCALMVQGYLKLKSLLCIPREGSRCSRHHSWETSGKLSSMQPAPGAGEEGCARLTCDWMALATSWAVVCCSSSALALSSSPRHS